MTDLAIEKKEQQDLSATQPEQAAAPKPELRFEFSPSIGKLIEALAKASIAFDPIKKESVNPFFKSKYADLAAVIDATRKHLGINGIAVIQPPAYKRDPGAVEIITLMAHSSGEWIKCILEMIIAKQDAQGIGSAITYGRRYSYSALLNVASEEDDDGNAAVAKPRGKVEESPEDFDQRTEEQQNIGTAQIQEIDKALKRTGKSEEEIIAALGFIGEKRIEHIKKANFQKFLKWANGTSKAQKGPSVTDQARIAANKRLWAVAAEFSIPEDDVKTAAYEKYGVSSMTELDAPQLVEMAEWVKSVAEKA